MLWVWGGRRTEGHDWRLVQGGREEERERMHKGHSWEVRKHRPLSICQQLHNHFLARSDHSAAHSMALPIIHLSGQQENRKVIRIVRKCIALWSQNEANPSMGWACYESQERVMSSNCQWMFSRSWRMLFWLLKNEISTDTACKTPYIIAADNDKRADLGHRKGATRPEVRGKRTEQKRRERFLVLPGGRGAV